MHKPLKYVLILAVVFFGLFVEGIDEIHHIEAPLTKGGTNWRPSCCFAARNAQLEVADNFSCHNFPLLRRSTPDD